MQRIGTGKSRKRFDVPEKLCFSEQENKAKEKFDKKNSKE